MFKLFPGCIADLSKRLGLIGVTEKQVPRTKQGPIFYYKNPKTIFTSQYDKEKKWISQGQVAALVPILGQMFEERPRMMKYQLKKIRSEATKEWGEQVSKPEGNSIALLEETGETTTTTLLKQ